MMMMMTAALREGPMVKSWYFLIDVVYFWFIFDYSSLNTFDDFCMDYYYYYY